jgi:low affinity Fe/Cu permease
MSSITLLLADDHNLIRSGLHALLKLDELLRGMDGARTSFVNLESLSDEELDKLQREFEG